MQIGSFHFQPPLALAPMAGVTNLPFRRLCREMGCTFAFTEMISIEGLLRNQEKTQSYLAHHPIEVGGLGVQIFGDDPERLAEAALWVQDRAPVSVMNINMGCPVDKVTRCNGGAALLKDPLLIGRIVSTVKKVCRVPLTIKIRAGWDSGSLNYLEILRIAEESGADALMCHPRTRAQGYSGQANWKVICELVQNARIPVFGNGDIFTPEDVRRIQKETNCPAVLVARGANGNPWIFRALSQTEKDRPETLQEVGRTVLKHLEYSVEHFGPVLGVKLMKPHFVWYSKWARAGKKEHRVRIMACKDLPSARAEIEKFYDLSRVASEVFPWWLSSTGGAVLTENHLSDN